MRAWRSASGTTFAAIAESCSRGVSPSDERVRMPAAACCLRPATRTWKNSSMLVAKIARNFARSSSGVVGSSASASTRALKSIVESSRLR